MVSGTAYKTRVAQRPEPLVAECDFKLWIPDGAGTIRSVFIINMRGAGKHLFDCDDQWRAMAARTGSTMMYCQFEATGVRDNGYGLSMLTACDQFADELGRPELKHAPLILWGHSMGGRVAQDFARFRPSRVLAFHIALRAFPSTEEFMAEEPAAMKIPALYLMGTEDQTPADMHAHFVRARAAGSPRAWVPLPGQGHWPNGMDFERDETSEEGWRAWAANEVVIPWTEAMIQLRLPEGAAELRDVRIEQGWLGDVESGQIAPYDAFGGSRSQACWFPNEQVAAAWVKFAFAKPSPSHKEAD